MRAKRLLIWGLGLMNAALLLAVIGLSYDLPRAYAQRAGGGPGAGQYAAVSAQYTGGTDALFLLQVGTKKLSVLVPEQNQSGRLVPVGMRDVGADLGG